MSDAQPEVKPAGNQEPAMRFVAPGGWREGLRYGMLGLPLAFVALPLYVVLPNHYARAFEVPLALLGAMLLGARLVDALIDPWIGRLADRLFRRSTKALLGSSAAAGVALALGFWGVLFPPPAVLAAGTGPLLVWAGVLMALTYASYSLVSVAHQSWGARLGGTEVARGRVVAWREGFALLGVLLASVLPGTVGMGATVASFALLLALGYWLWCLATVPNRVNPSAESSLSTASPLRQPAFQKLLAVFVINGTASAVPATLVLFFVQDRLQAPAAMEPAFLAIYFLLAACSIPLWLRLVPRLGLARTWLAGMGLAVLTFVWAATLGAGDAWAFLLVCALSGLALGTDLVLPSAMLAGLVGDVGERGQREGAYMGWWNFAAKMNLALAAGLALPLLGWFGYTPGVRAPEALQTLTIAYCLLPCTLKLIAAALLYGLLIRPAARIAAPLPHLKATP